MIYLKLAGWVAKSLDPDQMLKASDTVNINSYSFLIMYIYSVQHKHAFLSLLQISVFFGFFWCFFLTKKYLYDSYFSQKHVVGTHYKCLNEALLMSTHNIYFHREIRKIHIPPSYLELCEKKMKKKVTKLWNTTLVGLKNLQKAHQMYSI